MKSVLIILLCSFCVLIATQNCQNPLLTVFNLQGLSAPVNGSSLPFCNYLKGGETCCSNDTVQTFQGLADNLTQRLQAFAASRDQYLNQLDLNFLAQYQNAWDELSGSKDGIYNIQDNNPDLGNEMRTEFELFNGISNDLANLANTDFNATLSNYQQTRVNCFNTVLQVQASAWCLACDPNYGTSGVYSNGTIAFSEGLCGAISTACAPFTAASNALSPLFRARQTYQRLVNFVQYMTDYTYNGDAIPGYRLDNDFFSTTNATEMTNTLPLDCVAGNCPWQCQNLFSSNGILDEIVTSNGAGLIGGSDLPILPSIGIPDAPVYIPPDVVNNTVVPPANDTVVPPANDTVVPPANDTVVPPANDTAAPPANETVVPPTNNTTVVPPTNDTTVATPLPDNTTAVNTTAPIVPLVGTWAPAYMDTGIVFVVIADPGNVTTLPVPAPV